MRIPDSRAKFSLAEVTTIPEVCEGWAKDRKTVLVRVWKGDIRAQKIGGMWVLFLADVVELWGLPGKVIERG